MKHPGWEDGRRWHPPQNRIQEAVRRARLRRRWRRFPQLGPSPPSILRGDLPPVPEELGDLAAFLLEGFYLPKSTIFESQPLLQLMRRRS